MVGNFIAAVPKAKHQVSTSVE